MTDILIDPADRGRRVVVVAYVAHELARQILYGSEDASRNNVALNLGEPNFDLVEPARVGGGVVDPNSGVGLKEVKNFLGPVCTEVIGNNVDLANLLVDSPRSGQGNRQTRRWCDVRWF